jgi:hypothetical protein
VHQELDKSAWNTRFDDCLNFVVGTIREVGYGPAGIDEDLVVERVDELGKDGKSRCNLEYD